jgi:DNA-directed RNA polymerase sigma subunit (sigma70/sigma32)
MATTPELTEATLAVLRPRQRAVLKLRQGVLPLSEEELREVLPHERAEAREVRSRSLREVGRLIGVSKERIRQLENRALEQLGSSPKDQRAALTPIWLRRSRGRD